MRKPLLDTAICKERRQNIAAKLKDSALVIPANPHYIRNNDNHYPYRQDSNFFYLTGFEESQAVFVFRPGRKPETVLYVQPKDPARETWDGFLYGPDDAKTIFGMEDARPIADLEKDLPGLLADVDQVYYSFFINRDVDALMMKAVESVGLRRSRSNKGNLPVLEPRVLLGEARIRKTPMEIEVMKKACHASAAAHVDVMRACRPGVNERALHGVFLKGIMERGCAREGYGGIFATGANATTLHYVFNDQPTKDGDILLVDAGGEYDYYSADITRSYPVSGKFSPGQKRLYGKMLELQKSLVADVKPGHTREGLQKQAVDGVVDIMLELGIMRGDKKQIIESKEYTKFYMHGVSHWLGLDVHDAGVIEVNGEPRPLEPGFVLTVEPGIYIRHDADDVPVEFRGIGIRIEDDILVTKDGHLNLTAACPKEIDDLESLIGSV